MNAIVTTNAQGAFLRRVTPGMAVERLAHALHQEKHSNPRDPMSQWDNLSPKYQGEFRSRATILLNRIFEPIPSDPDVPDPSESFSFAEYFDSF